jgi:hypothetical protein
MGELQEKYREIADQREKAGREEPKALETLKRPAIPEKSIIVAKDEMPIATTKYGGRKRNRYIPQHRRSIALFLTNHSDIMEAADKENTAGDIPNIPNPKKRTKFAKGPSRQVTNPSTVLSPKSANSRTLPQSPIRPALCSLQKLYNSHPASPLKQLSPIKIASPAKVVTATATASLASTMGEKSKAGRSKAAISRTGSNPTTTKAGTTRAKRGAGPAHEPEDVRKASNTSNVSSVSIETTIVSNAKKAPTRASRKKDVGVRAVGKKVAGVEAPAPVRRVLRKRP